jgi:gamma-butyrobetaine dioxygenase
MGPIGARFPGGAPTQATQTSNGVRLMFTDGTDTHEISLVADWLRDNCPCEICRIRQTDERRIRPWTMTAPVIASSSCAAATLTITWTDGHVSEFAPHHWESIRLASSRARHHVHLWGAGYELTRVDYAETLDDLAVRQQMFEAFRRDGAVVVTGTPTVPGTVIDYVRALGIAVLDSALGFIFDVKLDPAGYNVAFTSEELPPHNDNAQRAQPPSGQVLSMLVNEASGGQSIVVDGWAALDELQRIDPAAIEVLSRVEVGFRQYSTTSDGFTRAPIVRRDAAGRFTHLRFSNQLMQPLEFDHPDLAEWYRAYRLLGALLSDESRQARFRLNGGDMLFVNGLRTLHARTAFKPDGPRHLQDIYFDVDDVASQLARLTGEAPIKMDAVASH